MNIYLKREVMMAVLAISVFMGIWGLADAADAADACKVLVVSSYHESFFATPVMKASVEEGLGPACVVTYRYLEIFTDPSGVDAKAREAFAHYQTMQPDGVIAIGEEAQSAFVVPYLREKVKTPVMFGGIPSPEKFDYPAANVSGISLHEPINATMVFAQQLVPEIATVGLLFADEPPAHNVIKQITSERDTYPVTLLEPVVVTTAEEAVEQAAVLKDQCDALLIGPISKVVGVDNAAFPSEQVLFAAIRQAFGKATFALLPAYIEAGLLGGVGRVDDEHGLVAAEMLQKAMSGTPLAELPIRQEQLGKRILNKTVVKELGIMPPRRLLTGTELVEIPQ
jgi:ABC-type uncharacterized transport system substrate-binding protein